MSLPCNVQYHTHAQHRIGALSPDERARVDDLIHDVRSAPGTGHLWNGKGGKLWYELGFEGDWIEKAIDGERTRVARRRVRVVYDWVEYDADCFIRVLIVETAEEQVQAEHARIRLRNGLDNPGALDLSGIPDA